MPTTFILRITSPYLMIKKLIIAHGLVLHDLVVIKTTNLLFIGSEKKFLLKKNGLEFLKNIKYFQKKKMLISILLELLSSFGKKMSKVNLRNGQNLITIF